MKFLNKIPNDKKDHFISGFILFYAVYIVTFWTGYGGLISSIVLFLSAAKKEIYHDYYKKQGKTEILDFISSCIAIVFYWLVCIT